MKFGQSASPDTNRCDSSRVGFTVNGEATKRIDGIVREGMVHRHKTVSVDYALEGQPFPFSEIAVLKSDDRRDAYLVLKFSNSAYSVADLQAKYQALLFTTLIFLSRTAFLNTGW